MTRASDAVFIGCGRIGTIHEFTVAYEDNKPIGILEGDWLMDETIKIILERSNRRNDKIVFDTNPKNLVEKVLQLVIKDKNEINRSYKNSDGFNGTYCQDRIL